MKLIENDMNTMYEIQGPMGKGLNIKSSGVHVAFTAGTGILVFIDLVAHLVKKNLGMLSPEEDVQLDPKFRFILFCSFPKKEEAIGFEMCQLLNDLCQSQGMNNFQFVSRFSNISKERWDTAFLEKRLQEYDSQNLGRLWVCGPPSMNELFDKYLCTNI
jgi:NAD(P)H-flavin reductase